MKTDPFDSLDVELFREAETPSRSPRRGKSMPWQPKLGPIGTRVLMDHSKYILLHGERGSLKTGIALNKVIQASYENRNNLAIICAITRSSATEGGAWEKLNSLAIPEWVDGIGLDYTEPRMDDQKNRYVFVSNLFGGWSRIILKSMPYGANIQQRIKGMEPGIFFFDELTEAETQDYFTKPIQQLRRPGVRFPQYIAACNPPEEGDDHWVYKKFFSEPMVMNGGKTWEPAAFSTLNTASTKDIDGTWNRDFATYHIPITENVWWSKTQVSEYQRTLMVEAIGDPTAEDRLIRGLWVKRPTGQGLFKEYFNRSSHVKGDFKRGEGLLPIPGFPIIVGYDLGQMWSSSTFMQLVPTKDRTVWVVFDEVDHLGEKIIYKTFAKEIKARMRFWRKRMDYPFTFRHITDDSAVNQWRPGQGGSYDSWDFEKEYNVDLEPGERRVKLEGCPKGDGSVEARTRWLQGKLFQDQIFISATCQNTIGMLMFQESDEKDAAKPKRCKWVHKLDSLTYPGLKIEMNGARGHFKSGQSAPKLIRCGSSA